jgi:hypothetical protein
MSFEARHNQLSIQGYVGLFANRFLAADAQYRGDLQNADYQRTWHDTLRSYVLSIHQMHDETFPDAATAPSEVRALRLNSLFNNVLAVEVEAAADYTYPLKSMELTSGQWAATRSEIIRGLGSTAESSPRLQLFYLARGIAHHHYQLEQK